MPDVGAEAPSTTTAAYRWRVLPLDEWQARQAELPYPPGMLEPNDFKVLVVVEDRAGKIVASWCAINMIMLEGLHRDADHPMASKHLLQGMLHALLGIGAGGAVTLIEDPAVMALATHAGFRPLKGTLHQIDLGSA